MNFLTGKFAEAEGCTTLGVRSEHLDVVPSGPWSGEVLHVP
jgi:multiple sugar transport system ATP-binding protein